MRIAIDARLNAYRHGGISQYTRQLLTALAEVAPEEEFVSLQHRDQLRPLAIASNVVRRTALTPPHHRFEQWALPLEVLLARPNVLHCPDFIAPLRRPCPAVVTIHDLAFMHYPAILDAPALAYYSQVKVNAPRADAIIAVSEATRQDIAQFLDIPIEQIDVIHEAAAPLYRPQALRPGEARVLNATPVAAKSFMLFVSTLEPRKNLPTLLQALRICLDRRPSAGYQLVVVGQRGWRDEVIFETVRDLKLGDYVLFAGGVGQYDLRWLYNACRIYVNPSLYEGFGLPLLEAMAAGAASLAAATSSLPEIGGDAAIYVPPLEPDLWADEIEALWDDDERQAELGRLGIARAQHFSWLRAARETLKVYHRAADRVVARPAALPAPPAGEIAPHEPVLPREVAYALGAAGPTPGGPRTCLRCGTAMLAGERQRGMLIHAPEAHVNGNGVTPQAFACPSCGYVELVVDWAAGSQRAPHDELPIDGSKAVQPTAPPAATADSVEPTSTSTPGMANDNTVESAPGDGIVVVPEERSSLAADSAVDEAPALEVPILAPPESTIAEPPLAADSALPADTDAASASAVPDLEVPILAPPERPPAEAPLPDESARPIDTDAASASPMPDLAQSEASSEAPVAEELADEAALARQLHGPTEQPTEPAPVAADAASGPGEVLPQDEAPLVASVGEPGSREQPTIAAGTDPPARAAAEDRAVSGVAKPQVRKGRAGQKQNQTESSTTPSRRQPRSKRKAP